MAIPSYTDQQLDLLRKINGGGGGYVAQSSPSATAGVTMGAGNDMTLTNRMNAGVSSIAASNQPNTLGIVQPEKPSYDVFSRPGDSFGDSQMREQDYQSLLSKAANVSGFGGKGKRQALLAAAQGMIQPGLAQIEAQNKDYQELLSQYGQQQSDMTKLGMLGGMDPQQMQNFMLGLSQIYSGNQSQSSVTENKSQPQATTSQAVSQSVYNPQTSSVYNPQTSTASVSQSVGSYDYSKPFDLQSF